MTPSDDVIANVSQQHGDRISGCRSRAPLGCAHPGAVQPTRRGVHDEVEERAMAEPVRRQWSVSPKVVVAVVLGVLALIFVFQNSAHGHVRFLFWTLSMPAWVWLLVVFVVGVVVGSLFPWFRRRR